MLFISDRHFKDANLNDLLLCKPTATSS